MARLRRQPWLIVAPAGNSWRASLAWLAVLSLLFPTLLSLLAPPPETAAERDRRAQILASLCHGEATSHGVPSGRDQSRIPAPKAPFCPICLAIQMTGSVLPAAGTAVPPPPVTITAPSPPPSLTANVATERGCAPPARAPPIAILS